MGAKCKLKNFKSRISFVSFCEGKVHFLQKNIAPISFPFKKHPPFQVVLAIVFTVEATLKNVYDDDDDAYGPGLVRST